jgi:hypothetical protein
MKAFFKGFIAVFTALGLLSSAVAMPTQNWSQELKQSFDVAQYQLQVEWDRKDPAVAARVKAELQQKLISLQQSGMSQEDFFKFLSSELLDQKTANELKSLAMSLQGKKLTEKELATISEQFVQGMYAEGANWIGVIVDPFTMTLIISAAVITTVAILVGTQCGYVYDAYYNDYVYTCY